MCRFLVILAILTLNSFHVDSQVSGKEFDRFRISYAGDSLIKQEYELVIKSKRVFFITAFASYSHIKAVKYRTRIKYDRVKKKKIFAIVASLNWDSLSQNTYTTNGGRFYVVSTFMDGRLISAYKIPEGLLPSDFKALYEHLKGFN